MKKKKLFLINIKPIRRFSFRIASALFTIIATILMFISWNELRILNVWLKILILISVCLFSFLISTIAHIYFFKTVKIWARGKNKVCAFYGDIFKMAFSSIHKNKGVYVIPVNDTFDTIVDEPSEKIKNPLVSPNTLHGKWIEKFINDEDISIDELDERIADNLSLNGYLPIKQLNRDKKSRGKLEVYSIGTVCHLTSSKGINFYLLVISSFDENNNAQSNKKKIRDAMDYLIDYYDSKGQGEPIYIPLMGTGSSRASMNHKQSLSIIKSSILTNEKSLNGELNIVVYDGDRDKVSIFD